jgi:SPP1 gp7 family putative phage head morphogenesis protein
MHGFIVNEVSQAYAEGTARAVRNLSVITDDYTASITAVLRSQPYLRRQALMQARVFEQMQGFTGDTARDLARVLRQGIENGQNPLEVAKTIRDRFGVSHSRAKTIARTEITGALRRARLDEAQETEVRLGLKTKMLWFSALSPTTRESHAERHGNLYTPQEVRNFYSVDGNAINCQCSQTETLVDDEGNPLTPQVVERTREIKRQWLERQAQEAS